jgi:nucleoid-associated protein YgaU
MQTGATGTVRWLRGLLLASVVVLLEIALMRYAGSPTELLATLGHATAPSADPVAVILAAMAAAAELVGGYLLVTVLLRMAAALPGLAGALARQASDLVTLPLVRRALDGAIGGALLLQVAVGPAMPAHGAAAATISRPQAVVAAAHTAPADAIASTAAAALTAGDHGADHLPQDVMGTEARPPSPPSPDTTLVPLPGWLGGVPERAAPPGSHSQPEPAVHVIRHGDTLWAIAEAHLPSGLRTNPVIDRYWRQLYAANRNVLGPDPDLIFPGTRITVPTYEPPDR